jgi:hypothetical protein
MSLTGYEPVYEHFSLCRPKTPGQSLHNLYHLKGLGRLKTSLQWIFFCLLRTAAVKHKFVKGTPTAYRAKILAP